jgi:hypothetical protein
LALLPVGLHQQDSRVAWAARRRPCHVNPDNELVVVATMQERARWLVAELAVIVLGVLIALALDAWYGRVVDARDEQTYLSQLIEDLRETERQMHAAAARTRPAEESARSLVRALRDVAEPEADSIRIWLTRAQGFDNPVPVMGTAEALVSTGDLRLVDNAEVRAAVTRWLSRSRDFWLVPLYQLEDQHRAIQAELLAIADRTGLEPLARGLLPLAGQARRPDRPPFQSDVRAFVGDPSAYSLLASLAETKGAMSRFRSAMAAEARELRTVLEPLLSSAPPAAD